MTDYRKRMLYVALVFLVMAGFMAVVAFGDSDSDSDSDSDCGDSGGCPPGGACCYWNDEEWDCRDNETFNWCAERDGIWHEGLQCYEVDCPPVGAGCLEGGSCVEDVNEAEYYALEGAIENGWVEGATCEQIVCQQAPAMGRVFYAFLALALLAVFIGVYRSIGHTKRPVLRP